MINNNERIAIINKHLENGVEFPCFDGVIIEKNVTNEGFTGYNMEQIIDDIIPDELKEYYETAKGKTETRKTNGIYLIIITILSVGVILIVMYKKKN